MFSVLQGPKLRAINALRHDEAGGCWHDLTSQAISDSETRPKTSSGSSIFFEFSSGGLVSSDLCLRGRDKSPPYRHPSQPYAGANEFLDCLVQILPFPLLDSSNNCTGLCPGYRSINVTKSENKLLRLAMCPMVCR